MADNIPHGIEAQEGGATGGRRVRLFKNGARLHPASPTANANSRARGNPLKRTKEPVTGVLFAWLVVPFLLWPMAALADSGPLPPCKAGASPPYPSFAGPPIFRNWSEGDLPTGWAAPACVAWASQHFTLLTALAASFRFEGQADDLLMRFGAVSAWRGTRYWSITDHRWQTLITDSAAVEASDGKRRRADFSVAELRVGKDLYFVQQDNRSSGEVTYRMRVAESGPDRIAITIENVSPVSLFIFTLFEPGDLESTYFLQRLSPTTWGYYSLSGVRENSVLPGGQPASHVNRAAAIFRHIAGVPSDQNPPLAP